jgi:hypothetical protein
MNTENKLFIKKFFRELQKYLGLGVAREVALTFLNNRVSRLSIKKSEIEIIESLFRKYNFNTACSYTLHVPLRDRGKGGYCNRFADQFDNDHPDAHYLLYIGRDEKEVQMSLVAEELGNDTQLGSNLGYPECCIDWYNSVWPIALKYHQGDLFPLSNKNTPPFVDCNYLLNFSANYFGGSWSSFFPCSLICSKASNINQKNRELINDFDKKLAQKIDELSKCAVVYTEYNGIFQIKKSKINYKTMKLVYDSQKMIITLSRPSSRIALALMNGDTLVPTGVTGFDIESNGKTIYREKSKQAFVRWFHAT